MVLATLGNPPAGSVPPMLHLTEPIIKGFFLALDLLENNGLELQCKNP